MGNSIRSCRASSSAIALPIHRVEHISIATTAARFDRNPRNPHMILPVNATPLQWKELRLLFPHGALQSVLQASPSFPEQPGYSMARRLLADYPHESRQVLRRGVL